MKKLIERLEERSLDTWSTEDGTEIRMATTDLVKLLRDEIGVHDARKVGMYLRGEIPLPISDRVVDRVRLNYKMDVKRAKQARQVSAAPKTSNLEKRYNRLIGKVKREAIAAGEDWAMDTFSDERAKGRSAIEASREVESLGETAASDIADGVINSNFEMYEVYKKLPSRGYESNLPTKRTVKDILAELVFEGIQNGIKKAQRER